MKMLEKLERFKILQLPAKRAKIKSIKAKISITSRTDPQPAIDSKLCNLNPVSFEIVKDRESVNLWNEEVL